MRRIQFKTFVVPALLAGLPSQCLGVDPLKFDIGPVLVRPQTDVEETYNDNVYFRQTDRQGDFISTFTPGLALSVGHENANHVIVDYQAPYNLYAKNSTLDGWAQIVKVDAQYAAPRTTIQAKESYDSEFGILGGATQLQTPLRFDSYQDEVSVGYDVAGKTSLYAKADYTAVEFERNFPLVDYADARATFGANYKLTPKTSIFVEGYVGHVATKSETPTIANGPSALYYGAFAGVQGSLATKFTWYAKVGYELRGYSDDTSAPSAVVAELDLAYHPLPRTILDLNFFRGNLPSIQYANENLVLDRVRTTASRTFGTAERLEALIGVDYSSFGYDSAGLSGRTDQVIVASVEVKYHFNEWMMADCGYNFSRWSTTGAIPVTDNLEYNINKVFVALKFGYKKTQ
jgi:hypothetical protein